ncbi:sulfite reductase, subunit C [Desulfotomaculum nigrificans CO-1-SRB]|uniref:Sulfite reductase, subunit C n=1 Tax=Desulfotomaculum nigrificans (strain DSM 14880 / VKM B-2319 / CO-1-SRB) TaxID=868595 RepID=F6B6X7_DESCC|nr:sulfite reductase subunit C [Desulfotomaculum nigrificans]AEF93302.1 sulfite reductase, subunit C [Desulfotomaculum nigrificans CO-1-SRB]
MSINTKQVMKNAWRITKDRNLTCLRIRVPGGHLPVKFLPLIQDIAERYGNGTVHITTRQGFEVPGISFKDMTEVNALIAPIIKELEIDRGVKIEDPVKGYPAAGTRNVSACIGNRVCPNAIFDTTSLAWDVERTIYPHDPHVKIAITGCPNDCIKAHMQDIGIIGQVEPVYDASRCIGCQACVKNCKKVSTGALTFENYKVKRDPLRCIGCGECVLKCPTAAWTRGGQYFRMVIMGRTGKKNPRLARGFLEWVDRDTVLKVCGNLYAYIEEYIDRSLPKEHVGYIVDRTGLHVFKDYVLKGVTLPPKARVANFIDFGGYKYDRHVFED